MVHYALSRPGYLGRDCRNGMWLMCYEHRQCLSFDWVTAPVPRRKCRLCSLNLGAPLPLPRLPLAASCPLQKPSLQASLHPLVKLLFGLLDPGLPRLRLIYAFPNSLMSLYSNLLLCTFCIYLRSPWRVWSARKLHRMRRRLNGPVILTNANTWITLASSKMVVSSEHGPRVSLHRTSLSCFGLDGRICYSELSAFCNKPF